MSCIVKVNRHGFLALRIFWRGLRSWEGTGLKDTPEDRNLVEAQALIINAEMKTGVFDYLRHFPKGNRATALAPVESAETSAQTLQTIGEYYRIWIERKKPPVVRPGLARDYRDHFTRYILPKFETTTWADLTPAMLDAFRSCLITERQLALKSCRNIIDASFRACCREAREIDCLPELQGKDPFGALRWRRLIIGRPDPFTEEEREKILGYFEKKIYYPFVYTLFFHRHETVRSFGATLEGYRLQAPRDRDIEEPLHGRRLSDQNGRQRKSDQAFTASRRNDRGVV